MMGSPDVSSMMDQMNAMQGGPAGQSGSTSPLGQTGSGQLGNSLASQMPGQQSQKPARPLGTPVQEAKYLAEDVAQGVLSLMPDFMQNMLGLKPTDTPEEAAKKKQVLQRYQQLNAEQQQYVQQQYQKRAEEQRKQEEETIRKKQEEQQKAAQSNTVAPQGKQTGAGAQGAVKKLQDDRQKMKSSG
jgi:hypothetical protein